VWMGALSTWRTVSLFGNNVWIMGCTWLPNMSTYFLAVIHPWRVIMGPTEYCTTILLPKPSQNLPHVSLLELSILDFRLHWVYPNVDCTWCREQHEGWLIWPYHIRVSCCLMSRFYGYDWTPSFMHLSIIFSN
jgi:hypothetical protein